MHIFSNFIFFLIYRLHLNSSIVEEGKKFSFFISSRYRQYWLKILSNIYCIFLQNQLISIFQYVLHKFYCSKSTLKCKLCNSNFGIQNRNRFFLCINYFCQAHNLACIWYNDFFFPLRRKICNFQVLVVMDKQVLKDNLINKFKFLGLCIHKDYLQMKVFCKNLLQYHNYRNIDELFL